MQAEIQATNRGNLPAVKNVLICLFSILLFLYLTLAKVAPHGLNTKILQEYSGITFGLVAAYSSLYFITLLFAGFLVDRFGYKKMFSLAVVFALISTYVAASATHLVIFTSAIALLAVANALGLISALKVGTSTLSRQYFGFFAAVLFASLLLMYHLGLHQDIFRLLAQTAHLGLILSLAGVVLLLLLLMISPVPLAAIDNPINTIHCPIISNYKLWLIVVVLVISQFFVNSFSLYGQIFLGQYTHLTSEQIAHILININHALLTGMIVTGVLCSIIDRKQFLIAGGYLTAAILFIFFTCLPQLSYPAILSLLCLTGFFLGTNVACYALAYDHCPNANQTGKLFSFVVLLTLLGNGLTLLPVESLIDASYKTHAVGVANAISLHSSKIFLAIAISLIVGAVIAFFQGTDKE